MPYTFTVDTARRRVSGTLIGACTIADLRQLQDEVRADPSFDPSFEAVVDCDAMTAFEGSLAEMLRLGETDPFRHPGRCAYFARRDGIYGLLRMWETTNRDLSQREVRAFRSREDAEAWLDGRPGRPVI